MCEGGLEMVGAHVAVTLHKLVCTCVVAYMEDKVMYGYESCWYLYIVHLNFVKVALLFFTYMSFRFTKSLNIGEMYTCAHDIVLLHHNSYIQARGFARLLLLSPPHPAISYETCFPMYVTVDAWRDYGYGLSHK